MERLDRHVGRERIPFEAIEREQLLVHASSPSCFLWADRAAAARWRPAGRSAGRAAARCRSPAASMTARARSDRANGAGRWRCGSCPGETAGTALCRCVRRPGGRGEIPAGVADLDAREVAVAVRDLEAAAVDHDGAVALALRAMIGLGEGEPQCRLSGHGRDTSGPARKRAIGASPISEWTFRLYSYSTQACVASLRKSKREIRYIL